MAIIASAVIFRLRWGSSARRTRRRFSAASISTYSTSLAGLGSPTFLPGFFLLMVGVIVPLTRFSDPVKSREGWVRRRTGSARLLGEKSRLVETSLDTRRV